MFQSQLEKVRREKEASEERIGKLEKEVAALRLSLKLVHTAYIYAQAHYAIIAKGRINVTLFFTQQ